MEEIKPNKADPVLNLKTPEGVKAFFVGIDVQNKDPQVQQEFARRTDVVRKANDGQYPSFWFDVMVAPTSTGLNT